MSPKHAFTRIVRALVASAVIAGAVLGMATLPSGFAHGNVPVHGFQTPSKNINCTYYEYDGEPATLACEVRGYTGTSPARPKDCDLDWNALPSIRERGKAELFACVGDTRWWPEAPVLKYGSTWKYGPFRCSVAPSGVTCTNRSNRGFVVRRSSVKAI